MNFLNIIGNVSPYPTKKQLCPGYLLNFNQYKILLDCGPGVCSKLNIPEDLNNLNIVISHFHKDHYLDLLSIAYASYVHYKLGNLKKKINVYIPKIEKNDDSYYDYLMFINTKEHFFNIIEYNEKTIISIDSFKISFFRTYHNILTYAIKIQNKKLKLIYGADMGYNYIDEFCKFCKNANYLILESSFIKTKDKSSDYHLSAQDAAKIAKLSNVSNLILTHFWPLFNKRKYIKEAKKIFNNKIIIKKHILL